MELTWESMQETLTSNNVPEMVLAIAGILALLIAISYVKNKDSAMYKLMVLLGVVAGVVLIIVSVDTYGQWELSTSVIAIVAGFALTIRPFKDVQIAVILGLFVVAIVYLLLGDLAGGDFDLLSDGWPRIIIAVVAGILMFTIANFVQAIVKMFGTVLNFWPILFILGLVCVAEAVCVFMGYGSVYDMIRSYMDSSQEVLAAVVKL